MSISRGRIRASTHTRSYEKRCDVGLSIMHETLADGSLRTVQGNSDLVNWGLGRIHGLEEEKAFV